MSTETEQTINTFIQNLANLVQWFLEKSHLSPQIEAILSLGLSQPYDNNLIVKLKLALDRFIGIEHSGANLLWILAFPESLINPEAKKLLTPEFEKWLEDLRKRFGDLIRQDIARDKKPLFIYRVGFGYDEKGTVLRLERGDGEKFDVVIDYKFFPEFICNLLKAFSEGKGTNKIAPEEIEKIRNAIALLYEGAGGK